MSTKRSNKQSVIQFSILCGLLALAACGPSTQENPVSGVQHVVVIGVDGMSPDGVRKANTPVMDEMMKNGAYTLNARGVLPTSSSTNWASMVSGAGPEKHGVTSNGWERGDFGFPAVTTGLEPIFPTIFGVTRQQYPDMEIGAIYNWGGFGRLIEKSALDLDVTHPEVSETVAEVVKYIREKKPGFLFVHLDHVDHAGHHDGHKTELYYKAVEEADRYIGDIIQATRDAGMFDQTVFIVSADHGGIGYSHGGESLDELEIPFIIYGKGVKPGYRIRHDVFTYDNAATIAFLLKVKPPYSWTGRAVTSAFAGFDEPDGLTDMASVPAPVIYPVANLFDPPGGFYLDTNAEVKIAAADSGATVRYTLDGSEPTEDSPLYQGTFTLDHSAVVTAKSFSSNGNSGTSAAYFRVLKSNADNGISFDYYEGDSWEHLPVFSAHRKISSGKTYQFRVGDIPKRPGQFAIRYKSYLQVDQPGMYKFYLRSDDGSKLFVNGKEVVNNDGQHGPIERTGKVEIPSGRSEVVVEYYNAGGGSWLEVYYRGPGMVKQIIPPEKLFIRP